MTPKCLLKTHDVTTLPKSEPVDVFHIQDSLCSVWMPRRNACFCKKYTACDLNEALKSPGGVSSTQDIAQMCCNAITGGMRPLVRLQRCTSGLQNQAFLHNSGVHHPGTKLFGHERLVGDYKGCRVKVEENILLQFEYMDWKLVLVCV